MTNPTERPGEREDNIGRRVREAEKLANERLVELADGPMLREEVVLRKILTALSSPWRCQGCEDAPLGQHTGPHDWERPEERDSLALIEERLAKAEQSEMRGTPIAAGLAADLRTLINEVKERDEEAAELRENWHRAAAVGDTALKRMAALEAEVKELREENARNARTAGSQHPFHSRAQHQEWCLPCRVEFFVDKSEQMEEALREAKSGLYEIERMGADIVARDGSATPFVYNVRAIATRAIRAGLQDVNVVTLKRREDP